MTQFRLDIPKLNENIYEYKNYKRACTEDINLIYRSYEDIDAIWIDSNTQTFVDRAKKDERALNEYFNYLDLMYNEIYKFKNDIAKMLDYEGYPGNNSVLQYNSMLIPQCKNDLQTVMLYLDDAISNLQTVASYGISSAQAAMASIATIKSEIQGLIRDIDYVVGSINSALTTSRSSVSRIDEVELNIEPTEYNWRLLDANLPSCTVGEILESVEKYNSVAGSKATMENMEVTDVSGGVSEYGEVVSSITTENQERVEGLDAGVKHYGINEAEITTEEQDKVEGLSNGVKEYASSGSAIETEVQNRVGNLESGIEHKEVRGNEIDIEKERKANIDTNTYEKQNKAAIETETTKLNINNVESYESGVRSSIDDSLMKTSRVDLGEGIKHYEPSESGSSMDDSTMRTSRVDIDTTPFDADSLFRITEE